MIHYFIIEQINVVLESAGYRWLGWRKSHGKKESDGYLQHETLF